MARPLGWAALPASHEDAPALVAQRVGAGGARFTAAPQHHPRRALAPSLGLGLPLAPRRGTASRRRDRGAPLPRAWREASLPPSEPCHPHLYPSPRRRSLRDASARSRPVLRQDLVSFAEDIAKHRSRHGRDRQANHGVHEVHHVVGDEGREGDHRSKDER